MAVGLMDGRRRRWIAWDTEFNANLGADIREEFGGIGCWVFNSYIVACKKNATQGRMSYSNEAEALMAMGIPGMPLVDEQGETWPLDTLWTFLSRRRIVRRERRGRVTTVIATKWEPWQNPKKGSVGTSEGSASGEGEGRQSGTARKVSPVDPKESNDAKKVSGKPAGQGAEIQTGYTPQNLLTPNPDSDLYPDHESDLDLDLDSAAAPGSALDGAIAVARQQREKASTSKGSGDQLRGLLDRLCGMCSGENEKAIRADAIMIFGQCQHHGVPEGLLESAINELGQGKPVLPRALIPVIQRHCQRRGLPAPILNVNIGRAAS